MKKTFLVAIAVLLALLVVTCDGLMGPPELEKPAKVEYTEDGRQLVEVKINVGGNARSITNTWSAANYNYLELVYREGSGTYKYYRKHGVKAAMTSVDLPLGAPLNASNTVLLLGYDNGTNKVLLGTSSSFTFSSDTIVTVGCSLTFTVTGLTTDVKAHTSNGSFEIDGARPDIGTLATTASAGAYNGKDCFEITTGASSKAGTLAIAGLPTSGNIVANGAAEAGFNNLEGTPIAASSVSLTIASGIISFAFTASTPGEYIITVNIPVAGFSNDTGENTADSPNNTACDWRIRGGALVGPEYDTNVNNDGIFLSVVQGTTPVGIIVDTSPWA